MSRPKATEAKPQSYFSIERGTNGYLINKITVQDNKVISLERISEPDVFQITAAKLITAFRKILN